MARRCRRSAAAARSPASRRPRRATSAAPVRELEQQPAALVERVVAAQVGALADEPGHPAVGDVALLVGLGDEDDVAGRRLAAAGVGGEARRPAPRARSSCRAAPRPTTWSSRSAPSNGSTVQLSAGAGTTSVCPISISDGPSPAPGIRAIRLSRSGSGPASSHSIPERSRYAASELGGGGLAARADSTCRPGSAPGSARRPRREAASRRAARLALIRRQRGRAAPRRVPGRARSGTAPASLPSRRSRRPRRDEAVEDRLVRRLVGGGEERRRGARVRGGVAGRRSRTRRRSRPIPPTRRSPLARGRAAAAAPAGAAACAPSGASVAQTAMHEPSGAGWDVAGSSRSCRAGRGTRGRRSCRAGGRRRGGRRRLARRCRSRPGSQSTSSPCRRRRCPPRPPRPSAASARSTSPAVDGARVGHVAVVALADDRDDDVLGTAPGRLDRRLVDGARRRECRRGRPASRSARSRRSRACSSARRCR